MFAPSRAPRRRSALPAAVAVVALTVALLAGCTAPGYIGASQDVTLRWHCWNAIFVKDGPEGTHWWAGRRPIPTGILMRDPGAGDGSGEHVSAGTLRFDTADAATFTSTFGGTLAFVRVEPGASYPADCLTRPM